MNARNVYGDNVAKALINGAGPAHKRTAIDYALPPLRLTIGKTTEQGNVFITNPIAVAHEHSTPWEKEWGGSHPDFQKEIVECFKKLRKDSLEGAAELAQSLDTSASKVRDALRVFSCTTATGCGHLNLRRMAKLPNNVPEQLGALFKQSIATLTVPMQELMNLLSLLGKKAGGSRTIAIWRPFTGRS